MVSFAKKILLAAGLLTMLIGTPFAEAATVRCGEQNNICTKTDKSCANDEACKVPIGGFICSDNYCHYDEIGMAAFERGQTSIGPIKVQNDISEIKKPTLEIHIPGLGFSDVSKTLDSEGYIHVPFIGEMISALYKFGLAIGSILAVVMLIKNGVKIVLSAGGNEKVDAYQQIGKVFIGLGIMWGSFALLYTINPRLVEFKALRIKYIEPIKYEYSGDLERPLQLSAIATTLGKCPRAGGAAAIPDIVSSYARKITYRFGGKGNTPPYSEIKPEYQQYNTNCPDGNVCLDCSGFVNFVYYCAGLPTIDGGTKTMFESATKIQDGKLSYAENKVNDQVLQPGDLLGWISSGNNVGHVVMYIGGGQVVESRGGEAGRKPGANPTFRNLNALTKYPFTHIRRLTPTPATP